jgi:hypothetical protein
MVNYANSKVYKIWSTQGDKIYVGSTTKQYLSQRMDKHRMEYRYWKTKQKTFISSYELFDEYGLENCFIELLEAQGCNSRDELHKLEGKHIRELDCVNKIVAGRTRKQHYAENKEQLSLNAKSRYELNKDKVSERQNQMYNCECGGKYTHVHKSRHTKSIKHCQFIESQKIKPEDGVE